MDFKKELEILINKNSKENGSDTPDFVLAEYLTQCLSAFDVAVNARTNWYRHSAPEPDLAQISEQLDNEKV